MRLFRRLLAASLLVWLASCNDSVPTSPTNPSLPAPQSYVVSGCLEPRGMQCQSTQPRSHSRTAPRQNASGGVGPTDDERSRLFIGQAHLTDSPL